MTEEPIHEEREEQALSDSAVWGRRIRRFRSGLLGGLAAAAPSAALLVDRPGAFEIGVLLLCSVALAFAAIRQGRGRSPKVGVVMASVAALVALGPALIERPGWSFGLGLLVLALVSWRRRPSRIGGLDAVSPAVLPVWGVLGPALSTTLIAALAPLPTPVFALSAGATSSFAALLGAGAIGRLEREPGARVRLGVFWLLFVLGAAVSPDLGLRCALLLGAGCVPLAADRAERGRGPFAGGLTAIEGRPELMLAAGFGATILVGALVLALPVSLARGAELGPIDAFFTAVSATCVTGLIVVDTPGTFSGFGQVVLLGLIQAGGLGIMTFSTAALFVFRRRPSVRHERALADVFVAWEGYDPASAVRRILLVTFVAEGLGALLLAGRFATRYAEPLGASMWRGLFTAVSAFCNAGFALQTESLVPYQDDAFVTSIVGLLIFVGALGPAVVLALRSSLRMRRTITVRLVVLTSSALVLFGAVLFAAFEWNGALADLHWLDRLHNALFQSVTLRTAGFNTVDFGALLPETRALMLALMFIGGAPGSTAGGIKTTTFAVILLSVAATVRGRPEAVYESRRISHETFYRAAAIFVLGISAVSALWGALLLTQPVEPLAALFEAVSALGTVGLSVGATAALDDVGKILVAAGMFVGRLGPVTVLFLVAAERQPPKWAYPEIELPVG